MKGHHPETLYLKTDAVIDTTLGPNTFLINAFLLNYTGEFNRKRSRRIHANG